MRTVEEVNEVLRLVECGLNDCEIERRTGIPRRTVLGWRHGRIPRAARLANEGRRCDMCGHELHDFAALPKEAYAYLLGMYLGDGSIASFARGVYRLCITLDRKYPGIVRSCAEAVALVLPESKVTVHQHRHENTELVTSYSKAWPCLLPQHGAGVKHKRQIRLVDWQLRIVSSQSKALLRGLIHSDGCRSINTIKHPKKTYVYPRYLFSNRSSDIRTIFCDACDRLGIRWRPMTEYDISIAQADSIKRMDEFIGPKR